MLAEHQAEAGVLKGCGRDLQPRTITAALAWAGSQAPHGKPGCHVGHGGRWQPSGDWGALPLTGLVPSSRSMDHRHSPFPAFTKYTTEINHLRAHCHGADSPLGTISSVWFRNISIPPKGNPAPHGSHSAFPPSPAPVASHLLRVLGFTYSGYFLSIGSHGL